MRPLSRSQRCLSAENDTFHVFVLAVVSRLRFIARMKHYLKFIVMIAAALALAIVPVNPVSAADDEGYTFKVKNTTDEKITKLLASEDGKEYGNFDIGAGIAPGKSMTLEWDKKTEDKSCEWYFKAVFADGEESEPVKFDFCEEDLELEF